MSRCAHKPCGRWRPGLLVRVAGLGLYLDDDWYCSTTCLGIAVRDRLAHTPPIVAPVLTSSAQTRLGGVLATQKKLAPAVLEEAASAQARTGLRIGSQLIELGIVTKFDVLRALAAQSGVGFLTALDPGRLTSAPGDLSPAVVNALGVVPFEADRRHDVLKVACTAPVPRSSLAALRELTGSIIEPYLVADDQWPALVQAYGASRHAAAATSATMTDLESLAARVTAAARQAGAVRMSEARCGDKLWVRLDAGGRIEELLLAPAVACARSATASREMTAAAPGIDGRVASPRPKRVRAPKGTTTRSAARRPAEAPFVADEIDQPGGISAATGARIQA